MREIKFRGKPVGYDSDEWIYGNIHSNEPVGGPYYMQFTKNNHTYSPRIVQETIGQFTSLYDKNGKEIYEGDNISFDYGVGEPVSEDLIEVRFVRGVFAFLWNGDLDDECPVSSPTHEWANVVGNIHDNPEMLKK